MNSIIGDADNILVEVNKILIKEKNARIKRGEDFNVFQVLGMESNENKTHSSFIAALLNPKGSHHLGDLFLRLFVKKLKEVVGDEWDNFNSLNTAKIIKEYHISKVDHKNKTGGRIDILIRIGGKFISIENKIYAGDQENQIERYVNFENDKNTVFYLTLDGKSYNGSTNSTEATISEEDYHCLSYKNHIKEWLEACLLELENKEQHILKASIKQYILLIKKLTGQMENHEYVELKGVIEKNFGAAQAIADNIEQVKNDLLQNFKNKLVEKLNILKDKNGNDIVIDSKVKDGFILSVYLKAHENSQSVSVSVYPFKINQSYGLSEGKITYGIRVKDGDKKLAYELVKDENKDSWWPILNHYGEASHNDDSVVLDLNAPDTFSKLADIDFVNKHTELLSQQVKNLMDENFEALSRIEVPA
jgi:hypothetical protein